MFQICLEKVLFKFDIIIVFYTIFNLFGNEFKCTIRYFCLKIKNFERRFSTIFFSLKKKLVKIKKF